MDSIIEVKNLCRNYLSGKENVCILENINLAIKPGTLTIIKGESGTGKTTLLNILGTLDKPCSGQVKIFGIDVTKQRDRENDVLRKTKIGFIFQAVALVSTMTAYENVEFMLRVADKYDVNSEKQILQLFEQVGLENRVNHMISELSGGEQQRVAIVRGLIHDPLIIFADEPTAELDKNMSEKIVGWFMMLAKQKNKTIIMTTHDSNLMQHADQIIELVK